ncbi:alpha-1-antiproteinase-like [Hemicordylus capensis]|uniref:alpha-1-antiproteinase-like n=1 Tax=Hemicordylus capensis TaxID=884348 RepID=UPI0023045F30|nr:alpha-1-antiproteinase-like [Hemicordylus capensis]
MANVHLCLLLAGLCALAYAHHVPDHHEDYEHQHDHHSEPCQKIAAGNADFAFRFYHQVASDQPAGKNILFSPLSMSTAFAMLMLGAKSDTLNQLLSGLGFNQTEVSEQEIHEGFLHLLQKLNRPDAEIEFNIGNALFTNNELQPLEKFLNDTKHYYQTEVHPTDFKNLTEAEGKINEFIEKKTHGKLVDVVKGLDPEVVMVLVNYMFLKAYWKEPFNPLSTREGDFYVDEETTVKVDMMKKESLFKSYFDNDLSCHVVQLPYKGSASALFILPKQGKMKQVEEALGTALVAKWLNSLQSRRIDLSIPKFSMSSSYDVKEILQKMGVTDVFTNGADLSGITGKRNLKVSKAVHKAHLNVHENGTEAAAATVLEVVFFTSFTPSIQFNHPFFMVFVKEDKIVLMGRVANPVGN